LVKLVLRNKEYEVKAGMTLLSALQKINILPESVIATREGDMILDDEILKDGDVIKLIAVISGGSCHCEERSPRRHVRQHARFAKQIEVSNLRAKGRLLRHFVPRNTPRHLRPWHTCPGGRCQGVCTCV
jgi:sulfur carrier protein ThiS